MWTWTALDADNKLCVTWRVGTREIDDAKACMFDIARRMTGRVQLSTDGLGTCLNAIGKAFGQEVEYGMVVKQYATQSGISAGSHSPAVCTACKRTPINGNPAPEHISTSFVERSNLTMRMAMRRFTRLTIGFSKRIENLGHAVSLHVMHNNFCRVHQTLRVTPAVAAGLTDYVWKIEELVALLDVEVAPRN